MKNNEYYTPDISEFHDDFEFEIKNHKGEWEKRILDFWTGYITLNEYDYRVKYLDEPDLKELGWNKVNALEYRLEDYKLFFLDNDYTIKIIEEYYSNLKLKQDWHCLFLGKIKNKSELKKLMKQLGI